MLHDLPTPTYGIAPLDLKTVADDGSFEGYASLFNREDGGRDIVLPGAFRDSLVRRGAGGIKMLFQHNPGEPIGVWQTLVEDAQGLFVRGRLMPEVTRARDVLLLLRAGAIDGLSIGFKTLRSRRDRQSGVRRIEKVDLWEISIVTFPMLADARVSRFKACAPRHAEITPIATKLTRFTAALRSLTSSHRTM